MGNNINLQDWLVKEDGAYGTGTDTQTGVPGNVPASQPTDGAMAPSASPNGDPSIANMPPTDNDPPEDVSSDPQAPDMPEDRGDKEDVDFETWKKKFLVESIKGNVQDLKSMIMDVRDSDFEDPYQRKFIEDNLQILFLRENSNINEASQKIRKLIKDDLDHNNPATSVVNHIQKVMEEQPMLNNIFIKLTGLRGMKMPLHREFIAALTGSVQVGSGGSTEDLIFNEKEYSIRMSTRFNATFGEINIGPWALRRDDPQRYLEAPELRRLEDGSPEEKTVLKRRIIMESIAEKYENRAFIVNVVGVDGTVYTLGWDISTSLKAAYTEGRLIVRTPKNDNNEVMIDSDGAIIQMPDMKIYYVKDTGEMGGNGKPYKEEIEFMERKMGQLFLTADLKTIKEAASSFQGLNIQESPWKGNPSDLRVLSRCIPSSSETLLRQC